MVKDLGTLRLVLLPCHNMSGSGLGACKQNKAQDPTVIDADDTTMGVSGTIAAQYTRASIRCQTAGNLAVGKDIAAS